MPMMPLPPDSCMAGLTAGMIRRPCSGYGILKKIWLHPDSLLLAVTGFMETVQRPPDVSSEHRIAREVPKHCIMEENHESAIPC